MRTILGTPPRAQRVASPSTTTPELVSRTAIPTTGSILLHEYFERTADARPDAIAVEVGSEVLSYSGLERYANRVARKLRSLGVRAGSRVSLLLPRSIDAYAAMLGILKAGGAYVPLDPEWPADRVAFVLDNSRSHTLVTTARHAEYHAAFDGAVLRMDADREAIAAEPSTRFTREESGARPAALCYIIYTSGSTGQPKGVMVEHRNVCHLIEVERDIFRVHRRDRVLQRAPLSLDPSVEEIWMAWRAGAALIGATRDMVRAGPDLSRALAEARVSVMSCMPTLVAMMDSDVPCVRLLVLGGVRCPPELVERWSRVGRRIINTYGSTETTVTATYAELKPGSPVTIGKPLPGYTVHIVDDEFREVAHGEAGEICIGGAGVARGYAGLAAMTRERFVRDPFSTGGARPRLYRCGDMGRVNERGDIEFLGRADGPCRLSVSR